MYKHLAGRKEEVQPEDLIITNGCIEAVSICLMGFVKAGEAVAIESPTYFLMLQTLQELGLTVVEIPSIPQQGFDVEAFEVVIKSLHIKACFVTPNFNNPLGSLMPEENKEKLVNLAYRYNIPIIEDNIYSELYYQSSPPPSLRAFDSHGMVLSCSSFSKTLSPGLRLGWLIPGKHFQEKAIKLKSGFSICTGNLKQFLVKEFLKSGGYERYLRKLRQNLKQQTYETTRAIQKYFPSGTKLTMPQGGFMLWVELPPQCSGMDVFHRALEQKILIIPGIICANSQHFKHHIRISCGYPFTPEIEQGIAELGRIIQNLC